ncbi:MAG TPA: glycosyltransferase [Vicinamibacterales bacterium]|jgi:hypothetical protein
MTARGRQVVLVAPEFPPSNTAGAHRPRLFARHLPAFGWQPTVLTIREDRIEGPLDSALHALLDPGLAVVRTGALPVHPVRIIGDVGIRALPHHFCALVDRARRGTVDAVVLFGPPWFSFVHGPLLRLLFGIPYVIDYIDPWITEFSAGHSFPGKGWWYHRAAKAIEPTALRMASAVTAVSDGMLEGVLRRYPGLTPPCTAAMPYGAEGDDFLAAERLDVAPPDIDRTGQEITIVFTGAVQPNGRELVRAVLRGIRALKQSASPFAARVRARFYGTSNLTWGHGREAVMPIARELGVDDVVSERPERISYVSALAALRASRIVLMFGSTERAYNASKLYPAILSGRPVLALCHAESLMRTTMEETGAGMSVTFNDAQELGRLDDRIADAIVTLAAREQTAVDTQSIERYSARRSTEILAGILDQVTAPRALPHATPQP